MQKSPCVPSTVQPRLPQQFLVQRATHPPAHHPVAMGDWLQGWASHHHSSSRSWHLPAMMSLFAGYLPCRICTSCRDHLGGDRCSRRGRFPLALLSYQVCEDVSDVSISELALNAYFWCVSVSPEITGEWMKLPLGFTEEKCIGKPTALCPDPDQICRAAQLSVLIPDLVSFPLAPSSPLSQAK